jgi:hypothetical protein
MIPRPAVIIATAIAFATTANAQLVDTVFAEYQAEVEKAVENGLSFLAELQSEDGSFDKSYGKSSGVVALVGMAFLSKGHLPGLGKYGVNVDRCIDYVLAQQQPNGVLNRGRGNETMYAHNIATLFLSEVSGMVDAVRQRKVEEASARALRLILDAQSVPKSVNNRGGWRYKPESTDSDLSCSGWALMALKSARLNGARVPDESIEAAVAYLLRHYDTKKGGFGYTSAQAKNTLSGCGLLCLELTGYHGDPRTFKTGDYILSTLTTLAASSHQYYGNYYNAQATFQLGGKYWETYAGWMYPHYLPKQRADGAWAGKKYGDAYTTAMVLLSMTVPYRQLPIYQRDETVDEE